MSQISLINSTVWWIFTGPETFYGQCEYIFQSKWLPETQHVVHTYTLPKHARILFMRDTEISLSIKINYLYAVNHHIWIIHYKTNALWNCHSKHLSKVPCSSESCSSPSQYFHFRSPKWSHARREELVWLENRKASITNFPGNKSLDKKDNVAN